jgi:hypothetical protein
MGTSREQPTGSKVIQGKKPVCICRQKRQKSLTAKQLNVYSASIELD